MQAVILAAGKATRMGELCKTIHKCMLSVGGKPILEWNMENVSGYVTEYIIIVGYRKEDIKNYFGSEFKGKKITYVEQQEQKGTGHALLQVKDKVTGKFIVMMGDDWYPSVSIEEKLMIFAQKVNNPEKFGVLEVINNKLTGIKEKPDRIKNALVNVGFYVLDEKIFDILQGITESTRGELELTDAVVKLDLEVKEITGWKGIAYPWELLEVNKLVIVPKQINGKTEDNVQISGNVSVGKGTVVKSGSYIESGVFVGENCVIGPNAYIRSGSSIGNNCNIGQSEIKNSIIMDGSNVPHYSYVGDSIIGRGCNLGAGTMIANLRFDNKTVHCNSKGRRDTGLRKLGVVMCDNVKTGVNVSIMPGVVIGNGKQIMPGEVVLRDVI